MMSTVRTRTRVLAVATAVVLCSLTVVSIAGSASAAASVSYEPAGVSTARTVTEVDPCVVEPADQRSGSGVETSGSEGPVDYVAMVGPCDDDQPSPSLASSSALLASEVAGAVAQLQQPQQKAPSATFGLRVKPEVGVKSPVGITPVHLAGELKETGTARLDNMTIIFELRPSAQGRAPVELRVHLQESDRTADGRYPFRVEHAIWLASGERVEVKAIQLVGNQTNGKPLHILGDNIPGQSAKAP